MCYLSVEVSYLDSVRIKETQSAYSSPCKIQSKRTAYTSRAYESQLSIYYFKLAWIGNLFKKHLSGISFKEAAIESLMNVGGKAFFGWVLLNFCLFRSEDSLINFFLIDDLLLKGRSFLRWLELVQRQKRDIVGIKNVLQIGDVTMR